MRWRIALIGAAVTVAGCSVPEAPSPSEPPSPTGEPSASPSASPVPSPTGTPTASPTPTEIVDIDLGTLTLDSAPSFQPAADGTASTTDDGAASLQVPFTLDGGKLRFQLTLDPSGSSAIATGGVTVVSDDSGTPIAVVAEPVVTDADGKPVPVQVAGDGATVTIAVDAADVAPGEGSLELWAGKQLIADVTTGEERDAPRYTVTRTAFGTHLLGAGIGSARAREMFETVGWEQALAIEPGLAGPASLQQQYDCHVLGGGGKEEWNLEAFRPDFEDWMPTALQHRCNWTQEDLAPPVAEESPSASESPSPEPSPTP